MLVGGRLVLLMKRKCHRHMENADALNGERVGEIELKGSSKRRT